MSENLRTHALHAMSRADDWETPASVYAPLDVEFGFTLDVAASSENAKCARYFTSDVDGLAQDWGRNVCWMNPPYGAAIARWMAKAFEASRLGATVVCLVPSRTDTRWWHDYAMRAHERRFVKGRVRFERGGIRIGSDSGTPGGHSSPFPSAIVVFQPAEEVSRTDET